MPFALSALRPSPGLIAVLVLLCISQFSGCVYDSDILEDVRCSNNADCTSAFTICVDGYCTVTEDLGSDVEDEPDMEDEPDNPPDPMEDCIDGDGDGYAREDSGPLCPLPQESISCDARNMQDINPGQVEICDGKDNNCDGERDNLVPEMLPEEEQERRKCAKQSGVCEGAVKACVNGNYVSCNTAQYLQHNQAYLEDEAYCLLSNPANPDSPRFDNKGRCIGQVQPGVENIAQAADVLCDMQDNDCDGTIDEPTETQIPCFGEQIEGLADISVLNDQVGVYCVAGARVCDAGAYGNDCGGDVQPEMENTPELRCNDIDNDCDGTVREDCNCEVGDTMPCYEGDPDDLGPDGENRLCQMGIQTCGDDNRFGSCVGQIFPGIETCQNIGVDDDCNGIIDDIQPGQVPGGACTSDFPGVCSAGTYQCNDSDELVCTPIIAPNTQPEICANRTTDNDCDGIINDVDVLNNDALEDVTFGDDCVTGLEGICSPGFYNCVGDFLQCEQLVNPLGTDIGNASQDNDNNVFTCNNQDDDCDGVVDENTRFYQSPNCGECGITCDEEAQGCCFVPGSGSDVNTSYTCTSILTAAQNNAVDAQNCGGCGFDPVPGVNEDGDPIVVDVAVNTTYNCAARVNGETTCCTSGCADLETDVNNCGTCGIECDGDEACVSGSCQPANLDTRCGVDAQEDCTNTGQICCLNDINIFQCAPANTDPCVTVRP